MRNTVVGACRLLGKYVPQKATGTSHYGPLSRLSPCVTCTGRCTAQGDNHGLGGRVIQLSISLLLVGHLMVQALEKIPVQCSVAMPVEPGGCLGMGGSSSMLHNAGGKGDASDLSFSMCPSSPIFASLLSLVSIPVTPTSAWAGQWSKEENTTGPNRAKRSRWDQHGGAGYGTRVASWISLQIQKSHSPGDQSALAG